MQPVRSSLAAVALGLVACSASPARGNRPPVASASAAPSASASAAPRTPMTVDEAMASLRAARADAERREGRPSLAQFRDAGADLRDAGVTARVSVVRATGVPKLATPKFGIVPVWHGDESVLVFELGEGTSPRLSPRKLLGTGSDSGKLVALGESFVFQRNGGTALLFTSVDAAPIEIPATYVRQSKHGWFAFSSGDELRVLDARTGREILPTTHGVDDIYGGWTNDEKWFGVCNGSTGEKPAIVIDVASQKTLFQSHVGPDESVLGCELDGDTHDLAIAYFDAKADRTTLEGWNLDTGKRWMTKVVASSYIPDLSISVDSATHVATLESAPYQGSREPRGRFDLHSGASLGIAPPKPPVARAPTGKPAKGLRDPLSGIPVGEASSATDLADLESLASSGKSLVHNWWSYNAGWAENGVLSTDRKWLAVLEDGASASGPAPSVLVVDAEAFRASTSAQARDSVRHEIGLPGGYHWSSMSFLDATTLVVRLEWHHWVIDAPTGAILASAEYDATAMPGDYEPVALLAPTEILIGARVFDLRRDLDPKQDREMRTPWATLQLLETTTDTTGLSTYAYGDRVAFEMNDSGIVTFSRPAIPDWLVCEVKGEVFPFEACGAWESVTAK